MRTPATPIVEVPEENETFIDPITGKEVTDPLTRFAMKNGTSYITKKYPQRLTFKKQETGKLIMPHWDIPNYFGFTERERYTYYKLCAESFYPLRSVAYLLSMARPSYGVAFVLSHKIPIYKIDRRMYVFSGDIVRAIESRRIKTENPLVSEYIMRVDARRWDYQDRRRGIEERERLLRREVQERDDAVPQEDRFSPGGLPGSGPKPDA